MKKIKFIKNPTFLGLGYAEGMTAELNKNTANELIHDGIAEEIPEELPEELPEDIPGRDALMQNGYTDVKLLKKLDFEQLYAIQGVGKATAEKIVNYFNE